jgi:hypothetical protein
LNILLQNLKERTQKINEVGKISFPELVLDIIKTKQKQFDSQQTTASTEIQEDESRIDRPVTFN